MGGKTEIQKRINCSVRRLAPAQVDQGEGGEGGEQEGEARTEEGQVGPRTSPWFSHSPVVATFHSILGYLLCVG